MVAMPPATTARLETAGREIPDLHRDPPGPTMNLSDFARNPLGAFQYAERYVNDGSPSGFTERQRSSPTTDPFGLTPFFRLRAVKVVDNPPTVIGQVPELLPGEQDLGGDWFVVHPDMAEHLTEVGVASRECENLTVVPTSSCRTVQVRAKGRPDFIKLHYGVLGRLHRELGADRVRAGVDVSSDVLRGVAGGHLPERLGLFHESGGKVVTIPTPTRQQEIGLIWREGWPVARRAADIEYLVPLFSLWSIDRLHSCGPCLADLITRDVHGGNPAWAMEEVALPCVAVYFSLVTRMGYQLQTNAQNIVLAFDAGWRVVSIVIRDLNGTEKDLELRRALRLPDTFASGGYQCLDRDADPEQTRIRRSFAFDFKLGEYVLSPLLDCLPGDDGAARRRTGLIREAVGAWAAQLPPDYFPQDGCWYASERVAFHGQPPFTPRRAPRYR